MLDLWDRLELMGFLDWKARRVIEVSLDSSDLKVMLVMCLKRVKREKLDHQVTNLILDAI